MHMVKSLAFVAEEISEHLRVKIIPHEQVLTTYTGVLRETNDKFKKSNVKQVLQQLLELMRVIVKSFDRNQVLEDCEKILESYKAKVEKVKNLSKKVKQGDRNCIEVIKQKKDIEETMLNI